MRGRQVGGIGFTYGFHWLSLNLYRQLTEWEPFLTFHHFSDILLGLATGPQGDLFVSDFANDIRRYDLSTGAFKQTISTNYTGVVPSTSFIGNLTVDPDGNLYSVGFDQATNQGTILRYDGLTGESLPSTGNSSAIYVPQNKALKRPIGITYTAIKVPEPEAVIGMVAIGLLSSVLLKRREAKLE